MQFKAACYYCYAQTIEAKTRCKISRQLTKTLDHILDVIHLQSLKWN